MYSYFIGIGLTQTKRGLIANAKNEEKRELSIAPDRQWLGGPIAGVKFSVQIHLATLYQITVKSAPIHLDLITQNC
jgi:hypothetical protein